MVHGLLSKVRVNPVTDRATARIGQVAVSQNGATVSIFGNGIAERSEEVRGGACEVRVRPGVVPIDVSVVLGKIFLDLAKRTGLARSPRANQANHRALGLLR